MDTHTLDFDGLTRSRRILHVGDHAVLIVKGIVLIDMGLYSQMPGGNSKIHIPKLQIPLFIYRYKTTMLYDKCIEN